MNDLREKLRHLPAEPGIYVMKDAEQRVIYVGKAKSLKSRVASYFNKTSHENPRLLKLIEHIRDFAVFVVGTETEALLLERTLIRHHRPLYNVLFTDDKEYPLVRVSTHHDWPTFRVVRRRADDGATYLGPYSSGSGLQLLLALVHRIFPLVRCNAWEFAHAKRPCNYYAMKQCLAPCSLPVDPTQYRTMVGQAIAVLQGKSAEVRSELAQAMAAAAATRDFEQAARLRDTLKAMDYLKEREQVVFNNKLVACDIFGLAADEHTLCIAIIKVRESKIAETYRFALELPLAAVDEGLFEFLLQYYGSHQLPQEIILAHAPAHSAELGQLFTAAHKIVVPQRGKKKSLLAMATRNAELHRDEVRREQQKQEIRLEKLGRFVGLTTIPRVLECLDISHHQGSATVASIVCFRDGVASKGDYRHYNLKAAHGEPDDYKSIYEIMQQRLKKAAEGRGNMPDLMVIDGGRGQLSAALKAAAEFPQISCSIVALAKSKTRYSPREYGELPASRHKSGERVFVPGSATSLALEEGSDEFRLLTHLRDEAHRFAITFHRKKQIKNTLSSPLETIPGVGPKLRQRILSHFATHELLIQASIEEFSSIHGVSASIASKVYSHFHSK
jgi:excinuclease ABC subunit C